VHVFFLGGPRKTGKSTLMRRLQEELQFSTALIVEGDVALIPVLMRTGPGGEELYES